MSLSGQGLLTSCTPNFPVTLCSFQDQPGTYTVTKLITNSYYLSGILARNLQTITGDQLSDGLDLLNGWLDIKQANVRLIPYFQQFFFQSVIGQERYFIPHCVSVESFVFYVGTAGTAGPVRYSTQFQKRTQYFGAGRVENIQSLPYSWHVERTFNGMYLYMYFVPNVAYPCMITGKFALADLSLNQNLLLTVDRFYIEYLRYGLAEQICAEYNIPLQPQAYQRLKEVEKMIMDISPPDFEMQKLSYLQKRIGFLYADSSLGLGWRP